LYITFEQIQESFSQHACRHANEQHDEGLNVEQRYSWLVTLKRVKGSGSIFTASAGKMLEQFSKENAGTIFKGKCWNNFQRKMLEQFSTQRRTTS
jgi:hypothetical protein